MVKILDTINVQELLESYNLLESKIQWTEYIYKGKQAGLQFKSNQDHWTSAVGKRTHSDKDYNELNPVFKDTIFEKIISKYKMTRTRLMWVYTKSCYSMHRDETPRIQIPLITNPDCYFVFKISPPVHLAEGNVYFVDTRNYHTFINCSEHNRLHLVGSSNFEKC